MMKDTPKTKRVPQHTWEHTAAAFDKSFRVSFENTWVLARWYLLIEEIETAKQLLRRNGHQPFAGPPQEGD